MDHLFVHTVEVVDQVCTDDEDGTPIYSESVVWTGAGRLNTPRVSAEFNPGAAPRTLVKSTVYLPPGCPVTKDSRLRVTTEWGESDWKVRALGETAGFTSAHHVEVQVEAIEEVAV